MKLRSIVYTSLTALIVTCLVHLLLSGMATGTMRAQLKDGEFNCLTVRELVIAGKNDAAAMLLNVNKGKPTIYFRDKNEKIRGVLGLNNDDGFSLRCFDMNAKMVINFGETGNGELLLRMSRKGTESGAVMFVDDSQSLMKLDGGKSKSTVAFFSKPDHSMVGINDKEGNLRCSMQHKEKFGSALGLSDGLGVDRFVAAITDQGQNKIVLSKTGTKEVFSAIVHKNGSEMRLANFGVTGGPSFNLMYQKNTPLMRMINGNGDEIWASPSFQNQPPIVVTKKGKRVWEVPKR